jgi:hypothetical protein
VTGPGGPGGPGGQRGLPVASRIVLTVLVVLLVAAGVLAGKALFHAYLWAWQRV